MRDHHVPEGAGGVVELTASLDGVFFGHVDLDVVDVVTVPDRLEQSVGETQGEDVLDRLFAEEVVDPEYLFLVEDLVDLAVENLCGLEVGAEGLLHDDSRAFNQVRLAQHLHHRCRGLRRDAQVVETAGRCADRGLGFGHGLGES